MITSLPNVLTLSRIAAIPPLVALFYLEGEVWRWATLALFAAAALTDYFDGYLARSRSQQSSFGRILDPVADKLLVCTVIFALVAFDRVTGLAMVPALLILCREILISGLREYLAGRRIAIPVSRLAKWKTMIQMGAIGFLIIGDVGPAAIPVVTVGTVGLSIAALLAVVTGYDYFRTALGHLGAPTAPQDGIAEDAGTASQIANSARRHG